jgi:imidazolonepropionase
MNKKADLIVTARQVVTCAPGEVMKRGMAMKDVGLIEEGAVAVVGGTIVATGPRDEILRMWQCPSDKLFEAPQAIVVPGLVDAHTHPLFAGSRIDEYMQRARGATYLEIQEKGGGIMSTVKATRAATDEELKKRTVKSLTRMFFHGTTTAEAKSGYGLSTEEELRNLRILREAQNDHPIELVMTFLGAHTIPEEHRSSREDYVRKVREEMLPLVARNGLAEFMDVFCEEGAFTLEETRSLLDGAKAVGLGLRIHAEQFSSRGSAVMAATLGATSCDHLLRLTSDDIRILKDLDTVAVFMPGTELFLAINEYGPAREAIDSGVPVALGTDFNAGSCLSESMAMALSLAILHMKLEPAEAINAATVNAAHSLKRGHRIGSLEPGKQADFLIVDIEDYREWLYHFGVNLVAMVIKKGVPLVAGLQTRQERSCP